MLHFVQRDTVTPVCAPIPRAFAEPLRHPEPPHYLLVHPNPQTRPGWHRYESIDHLDPGGAEIAEQRRG